MSRIEQEQLQTRALAERAILVACHLPKSRFDPRDPLGELRSLAETAGAMSVGELIQNRARPDAGTYIGKGKVEELRAMKDELGATLVIFDNDLSPSQIRNIEEEVKCKIIDRSELILDIFAGRATTFAAKLQVELAQLEYTYPRLRAMWSHLGQVTGGAPIGIGTRGPGETQIETDRRLVQRRKSQLKRRLEEIEARTEREVEKRKRDHFTVGLVGYTNAGKSTLFNALTAPHGGGGAYADNRLFATLTTRARRWPLGGGDEVLLADTVGFVRDLPHHLVASFRATLEEALRADLLLIVLDVSDPMAEMQFDIVNETLDSLEAGWISPEPEASEMPPEPWEGDGSGREPSSIDDTAAAAASHPDDELASAAPIPTVSRAAPNIARSDVARRPRRILVLNKVDLLEDQSALAIWSQRAHGGPGSIPVSAVSGQGIDELHNLVHDIYRGGVREMRIVAPYSAPKAINFVETRGEILDRAFDERGVTIRARVGLAHIDRLRSLGAEVSLVDGAVDADDEDN